MTVAAVSSLSLVACDPATTTTEPALVPTPTSSSPTVRPEVDPLVPFSPAPTPFQEITSGFAEDTLTLPTTDGGPLHVTFDSTALSLTVVEGYRSFSVWFTVRNPGDTPWTGSVGSTAVLVDLNEAQFAAVVGPSPAELHPNPGRYGRSNDDLTTPISLEPGQVRRGVIVFRPTGGNRLVEIRLTLDGETWGTWQTPLGVF